MESLLDNLFQSPRPGTAEQLADNQDIIEWRWTLAALTVRDVSAANLAEALDFATPRLQVKQFTVPPGPFGTVCSPVSGAATLDKWQRLHSAALAAGWDI